jgi:hypothetical protein
MSGYISMLERVLQQAEMTDHVRLYEERRFKEERERVQEARREHGPFTYKVRDMLSRKPYRSS